jgi:antirestriction protein
MAHIYVSTYAKYNAGNLHGEWLDPEDYADLQDFLEACRALHADESDPELMYQDHEDCGGFVSESNVNPELWDWLELDESDRAILRVYREYIDSDGDIEAARDAFQGTHDTESDFAEELCSDIYELDKLPSLLSCHIDWEGVARDLSYGDYSFCRDDETGKLFVFRNL